MRVVLGQIEQLKKRYELHRVPSQEFNPHYRAMSSLQNLGSVINTAFSVQGQELFVQYVTEPELVRRLYAHIAQLMLLCLDYFPRVDGWPLQDIFIGNCTAAMISPAQYAAFNEPQDRRLMEYAQDRRAVHDAPGLQRQRPPGKLRAPRVPARPRSRAGYGLRKLARLFPKAEVNCILFPSWIESHPMDEVRAELTRLMELGKSFPAFSFTLLEIDTKLGGDLLFEFHDLFRECALRIDRGITSAFAQ